MAKYVAIEINCANLTVPTLNDKLNMADASNGQAALNRLADLLMAVAAGCESASVKIVTKDAATTINTSGSGSTSNTFTFS